MFDDGHIIEKNMKYLIVDQPCGQVSYAPKYTKLETLDAPLRKFQSCGHAAHVNGLPSFFEGHN